METLHQRFHSHWEAKDAHPLLVIAAYVLDFLCIHHIRGLDAKAGQLSSQPGAKRAALKAVERLPDRFRYADVERAWPGVSRPTINRALVRLRNEGKIACIKPGRDAEWEKR